MNASANCLYDFIIVGAGPAGSTLARLIDKKYKVMLVDGQTETNSKPCGGLLSPDAQKALAELNLTLPKDVLADPQIFSVKTIDVNAEITRFYQRNYINTNRFAFDKWLLSLVSDNVDIVNGKVTAIKKTLSSFSVTVNINNSKINFNARYIAGADGANSIVRRTFFPNYKVKSYTAIQQYFKVNNSNSFYSCIFDKKTSPSCSWSMIKDDQLIFGGAFKPKNCRKKFEAQKKRLSKFGFDFSEPIKTEACRVLRPTVRSGFCTGKNGIFLIGEAAGFISPSSLEGISSAIKSAVILSNVINSESSDLCALYKLKTMPLKIKLYVKCIKRFFMYNPITRYIIMRSGIRSISISNDKSRFIYTKYQKNF